jgi:hypothetical protein
VYSSRLRVVYDSQATNRRGRVKRGIIEIRMVDKEG